MKTALPRVYIAILNWNCSEKRIACLHSLEKLDYPNVAIILVDNASNDDSVQRIQTAFPGLRIIAAPENRGYAGGNRLALEVALQEGADLFWILNPDVTVQPGALSALVDAYLKRGPGLYGSIAVGESGTLAYDAAVFFTDAEDNVDRRAAQIYGETIEEAFPSREEQAVLRLGGWSMMIPIALVRRYGFMDESFFLYSEETDYCFRMAKKGVPIVLVPTSVVSHEAMGTIRDRNDAFRAAIRYYKRRNPLIVRRRHGRPFALLRAVMKSARFSWKIWLKSLLFPRKIAAEAPFAYYEFLGVRDALLNRMGKTIAPEDFLD